MSYALCRNSDLIEELGQVEFIFSDKTGTLTQNKMEFKKCQAGGHIFGDPSEQDIAKQVGENEGMRNSSVSLIRKLLTDKSSPLAADCFQLFRLLAVCHTVVVDHEPRTGKVIYQASSPDELALIQGATQAGLILQEKSPSEMLIFNETTGLSERYQILAEFPFDSTRKRMTLIVKHEE